jgi:hypothetical protein
MSHGGGPPRLWHPPRPARGQYRPPLTNRRVAIGDDPKGALAGTCSSATGGAVDLFAEDVGVSGVPGCLARHVRHHPPQRVPVALDRNGETRVRVADSTGRGLHEQDRNLVFTRENGEPLDPGRTYFEFVRLVREAGLSHLKLHVLP